MLGILKNENVVVLGYLYTIFLRDCLDKQMLLNCVIY